LQISEIITRTGAAFNGKYLHVRCPEVLLRLVVEIAKRVIANGAEVTSFMEWLLCTWYPAHRIEIVANDIRIDREGADVELMSIPWYSQATKDIADMYATCSYDKHKESS
jgi:hypothetical protein